MQRRWWWLVPAAAALGADAASKAWASRTLSGRGTVWLWRPLLSLRLLSNTGAMLGVASDHARAITVFSALAVAVLMALVLRTAQGSTGLILMLGGAAGNLASRLTRGAVTDFIHLWFWPGIFNLADVFLRLGAAWTIASFALSGTRTKEGDTVRPGGVSPPRAR